MHNYLTLLAREAFLEQKREVLDLYGDKKEANIVAMKKWRIKKLRYRLKKKGVA